MNLTRVYLVHLTSDNINLTSYPIKEQTISHAIFPHVQMEPLHFLKRKKRILKLKKKKTIIFFTTCNYANSSVSFHVSDYAA